MDSFTVDINKSDEGWVQVTISGPGASELTEGSILAALSAPKAEVAAFGEGKLKIDTGTAGGKPAVFISPAEHAGVVGQPVPDNLKGPLDRLVPGEWFMTFPTDEQARRVADALCNSTSPVPALTDEAVERVAIEKLPIKWTVTGENNGQPIRRFTGYGHVAIVTYGYDQRWSAVVDHRGKLFDGDAEALRFAEDDIRERLMNRSAAAWKLRRDLLAAFPSKGEGE